MRFSEKLSKLRKSNNLSQEQLAEKLGVSRQAVSKWELGSSYPDMEKMLNMCNVLNCKLDELMDDGALGDVVEKKETKIDIKLYLDEFLKLITSIYNMFIAMKFKEKIVFLFEQMFNVVLLVGFSLIIELLMSIFISTLFGWLPYRYLNPLRQILSLILALVLFVLGVIIFAHLFKIRYLDYYITIVDPNASEKTIESSIENVGNVKREKLIIRDPKHSTSRLFDFLGKLFIFAFKILILLVSLPIFFAFVFTVFGLVASITHVGYSTLFLYISIAGVGLALCIYIVIEYLYKFVFDQSQSLKKIFYIGLAGLVLLGIGCGLSFTKILSLDKNEVVLQNTKTKTIDFNSEIKIYASPSSVVSFKVDENESDIKIRVSNIPSVNADVLIGQDDNISLETNSIDSFDMYKYILNDLKENKALFDAQDNFAEFEIISNKENIEILTKNFENNH